MKKNKLMDLIIPSVPLNVAGFDNCIKSLDIIAKLTEWHNEEVGFIGGNIGELLESQENVLALRRASLILYKLNIYKSENKL